MQIKFEEDLAVTIREFITHKGLGFNCINPVGDTTQAKLLSCSVDISEEFLSHSSGVDLVKAIKKYSPDNELFGVCKTIMKKYSSLPDDFEYGLNFHVEKGNMVYCWDWTDSVDTFYAGLSYDEPNDRVICDVMSNAGVKQPHLFVRDQDLVDLFTKPFREWLETEVA